MQENDVSILKSYGEPSVSLAFIENEDSKEIEDICVDMDEDFEEAGTLEFELTGDNAKKLHSLAASLPERHCLFVQIKYTHSTKDEDFVLAGIDFKVKELAELGVRQTEE